MMIPQLITRDHSWPLMEHENDKTSVDGNVPSGYCCSERDSAFATGYDSQQFAYSLE